MSVLIKGMEMPKSCEKCPCKTADAFGGLGCQATGYIPLRKVNQNRPDWCPLIPVPPHGRLIDANVLMENEENISFKDEWHMTVTEAFVSVKNIAHAPTIIEAEEGE